MRSARWLWLAVPAAALVASCGPELDPIDSLQTLRIMGLRKSAPYARPGETVKLELLWEDGANAGAPRRVERFIGFWCVNPPGDLFGQCLTQPPNVAPRFAFDSDTLDITLPSDVVRPSADGAPPYGVAFVFYGVCAGHLSVDGRRPPGLGGAGGRGGAPALGGAPGWGGEFDPGSVDSLVPTCVDEDGNQLGAEDFVIGYSAIYAYESFRNENPRITGFRVRGDEVAVDCVDTECVGRPFTVPDVDDCPSDAVCVATCEDDGDPTCPAIPISPIIDPASAEPDDVARTAYGEDLEEGLWVSYFTDRGGVGDSVRLVNDANTGWNANYGTALFAPKDAGPVRVWAVVRDGRGGMSWVRLPVFAR